MLGHRAFVRRKRRAVVSLVRQGDDRRPSGPFIAAARRPHEFAPGGEALLADRLVQADIGDPASGCALRECVAVRPGSKNDRELHPHRLRNAIAFAWNISPPTCRIDRCLVEPLPAAGRLEFDFLGVAVDAHQDAENCSRWPGNGRRCARRRGVVRNLQRRQRTDGRSGDGRRRCEWHGRHGSAPDQCAGDHREHEGGVSRAFHAEKRSQGARA